MLQSTTFRLHQFRQAVLLHQKHIEKFDAMSLASLEKDDQGNFNGTIPQLRGLERLCKEAMDILNEGNIQQQTQLAQWRHEIDACIRMKQHILAGSQSPTPSTSMKLPSSSIGKDKNHRLEGILIDLDSPEVTVSSCAQETQESDALLDSISSLPPALDELESLQEKAISWKDEHQTLELSLLDKELYHRIKTLYEHVQELVQDKLRVFKLIQEVCEYYEVTIGQLASSSGVLHCEEKIGLVVQPSLQTLLSHKLFQTAEEDQFISKIRYMWSEVYLGQSGYNLLAEQDLQLLLRWNQKEEAEWKFHLKIGCGLVLLLWSISECFNNEISAHKVWNDPTFAVFMCFGDLLLLLFMWVVSMKVWKDCGIDYMKLLQLQDTEYPHLKSPIRAVMQSFANDILLFLTTFIVFNKIIRGAYHHHYSVAYAHTIPVLLFLYYGYRLVWPIESRKQWLHMLWRVLAAPFFPVIFRDGYIGDLLTSLVRVSVPFVFSIVYVLLSIYAWLANDWKYVVNTSDRWWTGKVEYSLVVLPVLTLLPLWIRLVQCLRRSVETGQRWPHFGNALKYTSAMVVIAYGTFQPQVRYQIWWLFGFTFATCFQFLWDVFQDWGILQLHFPTAKNNNFNNNNGASSVVNDWIHKLSHVRVSIRSKRLLGPKWVYLVIMVINLALRFAWTLTLMPPETEDSSLTMYSIFMRHVTPFIAAAEIVRRMVWGFFRLEWEQIEVLQKSHLLDSSPEDEDDDNDLEKREENASESDKSVTINFKTTTSSSKPTANQDSPSSSLPAFIVDSLSSCSCLQSWESKQRLLESAIFAAVVIYLIAVAAWPAFHST